jgi:rubrerythrin
MSSNIRGPAAYGAATSVPLAGLIRTHWALAVCVVCGHEQPRGENSRATCPGCGAQLRTFALYRELRADS